MNEHELKELIRTVTAQVLAGLETASAVPAGTEGMKKLLVIGGNASAHLTEGAVALDIGDYEQYGNIQRYDRLVITALTFPQLADIALGRGGDSVSEAVLCALLSGIEVIMTEDALPFRAYAGKGSTPLYQLLEGYARTLRVFGVKPAEREFRPAPLPPARPAKFQPQPAAVPTGSARPNSSLLITEADALELIRQGDTVRISAASILTPSARDVFAGAKVTVVKE